MQHTATSAAGEQMGESREQMGERRLGAALWLEVFSFVGPERPHRKTVGVWNYGPCFADPQCRFI